VDVLDPQKEGMAKWTLWDARRGDATINGWRGSLYGKLMTLAYSATTIVSIAVTCFATLGVVVGSTTCC